MAGQILSGDTPAELIEHYTEYSGRMRPLPEWILGGAVVGVQGGTDKVLDVYDELEASAHPSPHSGCRTGSANERPVSARCGGTGSSTKITIAAGIDSGRN